jgi:anti-sigma factor RsiW
LLHAYADGELDFQNSAVIQDHVRACSDCGKTLDLIRDSKRALEKAPYFRAPEDLKQRISIATYKPAGRFLPTKSLAMAAAILLVGIGGVWLGRNLMPAASGADAVTAQLLSDHLRSLVPGHLADVVSTDKHTVKPWFNGKLDYSPPVNDLAKEGFPLLGGRLDYLDGRRIAVLAYGRAKHIINLYVWPSESPVASDQKALSGYNMIRWNSNGLNYEAVSDLNSEELNQFRGLIAGGQK